MATEVRDWIPENRHCFCIRPFWPRIHESNMVGQEFLEVGLSEVLCTGYSSKESSELPFTSG